jgi:hypothetical protein
LDLCRCCSGSKIEERRQDPPGKDGEREYEAEAEVAARDLDGWTDIYVVEKKALSVTRETGLPREDTLIPAIGMGIILDRDRETGLPRDWIVDLRNS